MNICAKGLGHTKWNGKTIAFFCFVFSQQPTNQTTYLVKGRDDCFAGRDERSLHYEGNTRIKGKKNRNSLFFSLFFKRKQEMRGTCLFKARG